MILLALGAGVLLLMVSKNAKLTPPPTASRPQSLTVSERPQVNKAPASAQAPRADVGPSANQPWYNGVIVAGAGAIASLAIPAITDLFSGAEDDPLSEMDDSFDPDEVNGWEEEVTSGGNGYDESYEPDQLTDADSGEDDYEE